MLPANDVHMDHNMFDGWTAIFDMQQPRGEPAACTLQKTSLKKPGFKPGITGKFQDRILDPLKQDSFRSRVELLFCGIADHSIALCVATCRKVEPDHISAYILPSDCNFATHFAITYCPLQCW